MQIRGTVFVVFFSLNLTDAHWVLVEFSSLMDSRPTCISFNLIFFFFLSPVYHFFLKMLHLYSRATLRKINIFIVCGMFCMDIILNCTYFLMMTEVASLYIQLPLPLPSSVFFVFALFLVKKNKMHFKYSPPGLLLILFRGIYWGLVLLTFSLVTFHMSKMQHSIGIFRLMTMSTSVNCLFM